MKQYIKKIFTIITLFSILCISATNVNASSNYLTGYKWNKSQLTCYISTTPYAPDVPATKYFNWKTNIITCIGSWNNSLNQNNVNLSFNITDDASKADIVFVYGQVEGTWARAIRITSGNLIASAMVVLDDWDFHTIGFNSTQIRSIVMHEIGHTIGLADIGNDIAIANNFYSIMVNDVFAPNTRFVPNPTPQFDIPNIRLMYQ